MDKPFYKQIIEHLIRKSQSMKTLSQLFTKQKHRNITTNIISQTKTGSQPSCKHSIQFTIRIIGECIRLSIYKYFPEFLPEHHSKLPTLKKNGPLKLSVKYSEKNYAREQLLIECIIKIWLTCFLIWHLSGGDIFLSHVYTGNYGRLFIRQTGLKSSKNLRL